jgi:hypothetical protein
MKNEKLVSTPLAIHFKLTKETCPKTHEEIEYMSKVPYSSTIGSLMYVMVCTRHDIEHAVGVVRRYMNNPSKEHWEAVKLILRYLRGTATHALCFGDSYTILQGYVDSDMKGDKHSKDEHHMVCFYCRWNNSKLEFETAKGSFTFNNKGRVCFYYKGST